MFQILTKRSFYNNSDAELLASDFLAACFTANIISLSLVYHFLKAVFFRPSKLSAHCINPDTMLRKGHLLFLLREKRATNLPVGLLEEICI